MIVSYANFRDMIGEFEKYDWPEAVDALTSALAVIEQMDALTRWQTGHWPDAEPTRRMHPLTCGNNSNHSPLYPMFDNDRVVLVCADCDYRQEDWPIGMVVEAAKVPPPPVTGG